MSLRLPATGGLPGLCKVAFHAVREAAPRLRDIMFQGPSEADQREGTVRESDAGSLLAKICKPAAATLAAAAPVALSAAASDAAPLATLAGWYGYAAAANPNELPYDLSFWRAGVSVVGTSLGTWLAYRRSAATLPVTVVTIAASSALTGLQLRNRGNYLTRAWTTRSWREGVFNELLPILHGATLPAALIGSALAAPALGPRMVTIIPRALRRQWPLLRRLGLYYMVFSILGHWGEMLFCTGIKHGLIRGEYDRENHMLWDQWLFPFPAEGSAAVLMAFLLYPAKMLRESRTSALAAKGKLSPSVALAGAVIDTFFLNQLVCTGIDYTTGLVANQSYELWDYRDMPFNFQGQICLQNSLVYTTVATWAVWRLFPRMERLMAAANPVLLDGAFVGLGSFFVFLELIYHVMPNDVKTGLAWVRERLPRLVPEETSPATV